MFSKKIIWVLPIVLLAAYQNQNADKSGFSPTSSVVPSSSEADSSTTANSKDIIENINAAQRKIIKNADLKCRVKDVFTATSQIENLVKAIDGQVSNSSMQNQQTTIRMVAYKTDSLKRMQVYTTTAHITLRIPVNNLDSVLKVIPQVSEFIDSRNLSLDDVTYQYLTNKLKNDAESNLTAEALRHSKKARDVIEVSNYANEHSERNIDRKIENMAISEQVKFATLNVDFYQPERIDVLVVADTDYLTSPSFFQRTKMAVVDGGVILQSIFLLLLRIWPLILIVFICTLIYKNIIYRRYSQIAKK